MESEKARLRQQLLASESNINTLSGFAANGQLQIPNQGLPPQHPLYANNAQGSGSLGYSNHDLLTPVNATGGYSGGSQGRMSITSASGRSVQRLFRRKGGDGPAFDDETGADLSEMATELSFADIAHLRGNGRYNTSAAQSLDTLPIIPVIGGAPTSTKNLNNVQYRKYMNHQKKLNLSNGARAMSLAGNNPMAANLMTGPDPRSMSFGGPQDGRAMSIGMQNPRTMSLGGQMNFAPGNPRAMSLSSNGMLRNPGQPPMNRPRMGQMNGQMQGNMGPPHMNGQMQHNHIQYGQHYNQMPGNPRAQSLRAGNPYQQQYRGPPPNMRNNSLGGMGMQQGYMPMGARSESLTQASAYPSLLNKTIARPGAQPYGYQNFSLSQPHINNVGTPSPRIPQQESQTNSSESLMNVVEEDEERDDSGHQVEVNRSLPLADETLKEQEDDAELDHVYKFDNETASPQLSRKSTVKKSNSMRVRRLDLFKSNNQPTSEEPELRNEPSFDLQKVGDRFSKKLIVEVNDEEVKQHHANQADKLKALGATASGEKDVFITASEFRSPTKKSPSKATKDLPATPSTPAHASESLEVPTPTSDKENGSIHERQMSKDSLDSKKKPIRLRSLAANTAFSNFRSPSLGSQAAFSPTEEFEQPQMEKHSSETESQSSVYSNDTPKKSGTGDVLVSPTSEQDSRSLESLAKLGVTGMNYEQADFDSKQIAPSIASQNEERESYDDVENHYSDPVLHTESSRATSDTRVEVTPGRTPETSEWNDRSTRPTISEEDSSSDLRNLVSAEKDDFTPLVQKRTSALSRSNSELKMQGLLPSSGLIRGTDTSDLHNVPIVDSIEGDRKERRKSRTSSISTKSKSFIKRLSRSGSKKDISEDYDYDDTTSSPAVRLRVASVASIRETKKPLKFTKEELSIMTCNNDLQNELQLVTSELAMSIKRELILETQLKSQHLSNGTGHKTIEEDATEKAGIIAELLEKLNNERRLRFISEEHAILAEHGQSPSALKLDYEKNEIYKQLLAKNDLVNQLQDRLEELEDSSGSESGQGMLHKYNDLLRENSELRSKLEALRLIDQRSPGQADSSGTSYSYGENSNEYEQAQIISLRTQRDELREMLTKLTSSQNMELKIAQDRIKTLEDKLQKVNMINDKLSRRLDRGGESSKEATFASGQGGKLLGFDIVSPRKTFFDE